MTSPAPPPDAPAFTRCYPNVALQRLGACVVAASDDFFADKSRLLAPQAPVFIPDKYDAHGKWMDGWETRRRRGGGHDWCIIRLGQAVAIAGVDIDTSYFTGNYPHAAALEISEDDANAASEALSWRPLMAPRPLNGDSHHYIETPLVRARWLRLAIYPDGGVARLRVYGRMTGALTAAVECDLAAILNGGRVVAVSDSHFGAPENMLMPGRGENMGDGWETRRRREPGNDWAIIALGGCGTINRIKLDTAHFKGNYPAAFSIDASYVPDLPDAACVAASMFWPSLCEKTALEADSIYEADSGILIKDAVSHVRLNIYPDGGISRLSLFGTVAPER